ncbi:MAG: DNA polymerase III subunit delta [Alphaproteobacteria bacterium]|nr:DNA polymerase III subunit delta [Alphaproteobacteria bacterium]
MKLTAAQTTAFLQKPDPRARAVLVYGPDAGLVRERAEALAKKTVPDLQDPFRVALLTGAMLAEDPARLMDEMAAQALGGGQRLVRIQQAGDNVAGALTALLADMPATDSLLLIEGSDLEKRSKLRSLCEGDEQAAAIACYVEEGPARQRVIANILKAEGVNAPRDVILFLGDVLPPDRMAMRSELEKLATYAKGASGISIEDVRAVVQDAGAAELDDLVFAVGGGDARKVRLLIDRLMEEQTSPVAVLRAAQRHFMRLQWARGQMDGGASAGEAVKKLQPPVFWKHAESMGAQLPRWSAVRLSRALERLYEAEAAVKRTGTPDAALCAQTLLGLAA